METVSVPLTQHAAVAVGRVVCRRYHVLCGHGGVYADTDTICGKPVDSWTQYNTTPEPGLIVGIENRFHR